MVEQVLLVHFQIKPTRFWSILIRLSLFYEFFLENYNFRTSATKWVHIQTTKSTSNNKKNNDSFSSKANIACGIPQGSVLGPTLFCLKFVLSISLYADDTY